MQKDWNEIHPDFTEETQEEWEHQGFNYEETKQLIEAGFDPDDWSKVAQWKKYGFSSSQISKFLTWGAKCWDADFFDYLKQNNLPFENYQQIRDKNVEENNDWSFLHPDFANKEWKSKKTYQQIWEDKGISYEETKEWMEIGFLPQQSEKIQEWIDKDFNYYQSKSWIKLGLNPEEADFAYYLKNRGYTQRTTELKSSYAQHWIEWKYPLEKRSEIKEINISDKKLEGSLNFNEFINLEKLYCRKNKIISLDISKCPKLQKISCSMNKLKELDVSNNLELKELYCWNNKSLTNLNVNKNINLTNLDCSNCNLINLDVNNLVNLEELSCSRNQLNELDLTGLSQLKLLYCWENYLTDLNLSVLNPDNLTDLSIRNNNLTERDLIIFGQFVNLKDLWIGNWKLEKEDKNIYNRFVGSLEPLKSLNKLRDLNISNTDIDSGLDFLKDIKDIYCLTEERPESQVKLLIEQLNSDSSFALEEGKRGKKYKKNWLELHKDFKYGREEWEDNGFNFAQTREWIKTSFHPTDAHLCAWLRDNKNVQSQRGLKEAYDNITNLREEYYCSLGKEKVDAQDFVDKNYLLIERKKITKLDISKQSLGGYLDLNDFTSLEELNCSDNLLTSCEFLFTLPNPEKLVKLNINNNHVIPTDLMFFSRFVNLEEVWIGSDVEFSKLGLRNRFYGSLEPLKNLNKLSIIDIRNTDIDSGFEYLVDKNLEWLRCDVFRHDDALEHNEAFGSSQIWKELERIVIEFDAWGGKEGRTFIDSKNYALNTDYNLDGMKVWKINQPYFKKVEEYWKKVNPDADLNEFFLSQEIFFNVQNGTFEGNTETLINFLEQAGLINEKDKDIEFLKRLINELRVSKKDLMQRIVETYLAFPMEKEMLRELIKAQLQLSEAKYLRLNASNCREQFNNLYGKLKNKLTDRLMENTEIILTDCEELVSKEIELQSKLTSVRMEIDYEQHQVRNVIYNINAPITSNHGHVLFNNLISDSADFSFNKQITYQSNFDEKLIQELFTELTNIKQIIEQNNEKIKVASKEQTNELLTIDQLTSKDKERLKKAINFLNAKQIFLNTRQGTIELLQKCCDKFEKSITTGKHAKSTIVGNILSNVIGEALNTVPLIPIGSPVKAVGGLVTEKAEISKIKGLEKCAKEFREYLNNDESKMSLLNEYYESLVSVVYVNQEQLISSIIIDIFKLERNKKCPFTNEYNIYNLISIWKNKSVLTLEEMKEVIKSLSENLKELKLNLKNEEKQFSERIKFVGNQLSEDSDRWTNISSNFTPELAQEWVKHGFTYKECADWISISHPSQHLQLIQEPAFYAWLRDEIKIRPEEVLNDNSISLKELKEHFKELKQQELQTKIEILPK